MVAWWTEQDNWHNPVQNRHMGTEGKDKTKTSKMLLINAGAVTDAADCSAY